MIPIKSPIKRSCCRLASSLSLVVDPETFLGHVDAAHSERRMSGGAEAWRAVKPRPPPGEDAAGVDTLDATVDTSAAKGKRGRTSDPPGKIRGTPPTLLAPPDFTNDGVGSSPASASWEEGAMEAERLYLDNKRRRLDAPTETEATSPERPPAPRNLCLLYTSPSPRDLSTSRMPSSA